MNSHANSDEILARFRETVANIYGERLERVVLFGSRARGDNRRDSDYDIAVFIREPMKWLDETICLANAGTDILMETGAVISAKPFPAGAYHEPSGLMGEIRRDGLTL